MSWPRDAYTAAIWNCPNLDPFERVVAQAYAEFAHDGTEAWVVNAEMTRRTGISSRFTIAKVTRRLVDKGWLVHVSRGRPHRAAIYRIAIPAPCENDDHHSPKCPPEAHKRLCALNGHALVSISDTTLVSTTGTPSLHKDSIDPSAGGRRTAPTPPPEETPADPRVGEAVLRLLRAKEAGENARAKAREELGDEATEAHVLIRAGELLEEVSA